jgi:hypothetical protein
MAEEINRDPLTEYLLKSPDASRIGKAVEHLVAASCILASRARLNVSTALVDDEGVDLVFHRRGASATIAAQVKSRGSDTTSIRRRQYTASVRSQTFRPRHDLYMLFVVVDAANATFGPVWLVPSVNFESATFVSKRGLRRFTASTSATSKDKWASYKVDGEQVAKQLSEKILRLLNDDADSA